MARSIVFDGEQEDSFRDFSRRVQGLRKHLRQKFNKIVEAGTSTNPAFQQYATKKNSAIIAITDLKGIQFKTFRDELNKSGCQIINESKDSENSKRTIFEIDPSGIQDSFLI